MGLAKQTITKQVLDWSKGFPQFRMSNPQIARFVMNSTHLAHVFVIITKEEDQTSVVSEAGTFFDSFS